jgi:O-antigen ligase
MDRTGARSAALAALPFLPAAAIVTGWVLWSHFEGGYFLSTWYPSAILAVLLLLVTAAAGGRALPRSRWSLAALGFLASLVAWTALSLLWSGSAGTGWDAVNKLVLALAVAWTISLLPWTARSASVALGAWTLGVATVCAISIVGAATGDDIGAYFIEGRYLDPVGYSNAVSALPAMALFAALAIACRRATPAPVRVLFLAVAVFLLEFSLLPQSRGSILGLAVAIPAFVLMAPDRLRLIPAALILVGATALALGPIYEVYDAGTELTEGTGSRPLAPVVDDAAIAMLWTTALAAVAAALVAVADRLVRPSAPAVRAARLTTGILIALVLLGGLAAAGVNAGRIQDGASERWETFKSGEDTPPAPGARITASYSDQRYDYWRVALESFKGAPVAGIGAGAYEDAYSAERRHPKPSRYTHDLWLRVLAETGVVGLLLLMGFLASGLGAIAWLRRRRGGAEASIGAACLAGSAYFFVHSSFDWLDEFPALLGPAVALPLLAIAVLGSDGSPPRLPRTVRRIGWAGGALLAALAITSLVPPYLAHRYVERATAGWPRDPEGAFRDLERAARLNPIAPRPHLRAAGIALNLEDPARARREFRRSIEVDDNWYAHMELALLDGQAARWATAEAHIRRAGALNARDDVVTEAAASIRARKRVDPLAFNEKIRELNRQRFTRPKH